MLGVVLALWVASFVVERRWPTVPRSLLIIAGLILLQGWWMAANACAIYDSTFHLFFPVTAIFPRLPGSVDYALSLAWMLRATVLLGAVCLVAELAQRPRWLLRLWYALAFTGGSIAILGLLQKATGAKMIFWAPADQWAATTFFASYFYHANAGAFLNLILPVLAGLALWTVARFSQPLPRAVWATTLLIVVIAIFSNTSRMAQAVGVLLCLALIAGVARPAARFIKQVEKRTLIVGVIIVAVTALAIAQASHLDKPLVRWRHFTTQLPDDARWRANRVAFTAIRDAGLFGFGPASFRAIFPHYQK